MELRSSREADAGVIEPALGLPPPAAALADVEAGPSCLWAPFVAPGIFGRVPG